MNAPNDDSIIFFKNCSDQQLEHNLKKEWDAYNHRDYASARVAAEARGWDIGKGLRLK